MESMEKFQFSPSTSSMETLWIDENVRDEKLNICQCNIEPNEF